MSRSPSLSLVEGLDAHRPPRRPGKHRAASFLEVFAADVLVGTVVALHVQHVEIGPAVTVHIDRARIAAPAHVNEAALFCDVDEAVAVFVLVQDAALVARFGDGGVPRTHRQAPQAARPDCQAVPADIANKEIEQAVAVEVEEHRAGTILT